MGYNIRKAAQLIVQIIRRTKNVCMSDQKLLGLIFLVDRESFRRFGRPVLDEPRCSTPFGPVNMTTRFHISATCHGEYPDWVDHIADRVIGSDILFVRDGITIEELDELSESELGCVDSVVQMFGDMDEFMLQMWFRCCADICEWTNVEVGYELIENFDSKFDF